MENVDRSFQDHPGGKDDSKKIMKKSVLGSSRLGVVRDGNMDRLVRTCAGLGLRLDKSLQPSNITQVSKLHEAPVTKRKLKKTEHAGPEAKTSSVNNLSSKNPVTEAAGPGAKSSSINKSRSKNPITEGAYPGTKSSSVYNSRSKTPIGAKSSSAYSVKSKNPLTKVVGPDMNSSLYNSRSKVPINEAAGPGVRSFSAYSLKSKNRISKVACPGAKSSPVYNVKSKNPVTEVALSHNMKSKVQKTEDKNNSVNSHNRKPLKKDSYKDSSVAIQKKKILKSYTKPNKKIETPKPLTASLADRGKKSHPLTSQHELFSREPVYHIRWEDEMNKEPLGYNCMLCNKDLLSAAEDDDYSEYDDDFQYDNDDEYYDDYDHNPPLHPAVDILSCGHTYHTDCLQNGTPKEQSSDPQCILCYNTS